MDHFRSRRRPGPRSDRRPTYRVDRGQAPHRPGHAGQRRLRRHQHRQGPRYQPSLGVPGTTSCPRSVVRRRDDLLGLPRHPGGTRAVPDDGPWWAASCPARGPGWFGSSPTSLCFPLRCSGTPAPWSPGSCLVCSPPRPPHRHAGHQRQPTRRPRRRCRPSRQLRQRQPPQRPRRAPAMSRSPPGTATCLSRPSGWNRPSCATQRPSGRWPRSAADPQHHQHRSTSSGRLHPGGGLRHA
jgi:hypothetical protein